MTHVLYGIERPNTGVASRKSLGFLASSDYYQLKQFTVTLPHPYTGRPEKWTFYEGDSCGLYFPSAHTYRYHPALWLQKFALGNPLFCHIPESELAKAFSCESHRSEPPRISAIGDNCRYELLRKYGLFCRKCQQPRFDNDDAEDDLKEWRVPSPEHWHWADLGICEKCATETKMSSSHRALQTQLRETRFREQRRQWLDKKDRERVAKREAADKERKERRILERASYELLNDLGLIDQLRRGQHAKSRDHRSEAPIMGKAQSARRPARRNIGEPESLRSSHR